MPILSQNQITHAKASDKFLMRLAQLESASIDTQIQLFMEIIPNFDTLISLPYQSFKELLPPNEVIKFILKNNLLFRYVKSLYSLNILIFHFPDSKIDILNAFLDSKECEKILFIESLANFFDTRFYKFIKSHPEPEVVDKAVQVMLNSTTNFRATIGGLQNLIDCTEYLPDHKKAIFDVYINTENFCYYIKNIDDPGKVQRFFAELFENNGFQQKMLTAILNVLNQHLADHPDADFIPLIIDFLNQTDPLYFKKVNRLWIAYELFLIATNSEKINQGETNLCGGVVFLTTLFDAKPKLAVKLFLELIQTGKTSAPLLLQATNFSKENHEDVSFIYLCALKEGSNRLVGYSPCKFKNSKLQEGLETFCGITEPKVICQWLRQCEFQVTTEAMIVRNSEGQEVSQFMRFLYGGVYDHSHKSFKTLEKNLEAAIEKINSGNNIIMMLSSQLSREIVPLESVQPHQDEVKKIDRFLKNKGNSFLGLMVEHYVVVKNLSYDKAKGIVNITICNREIKQKAALDAETFFEHYSGFISAKSKQEALELCKVPALDDTARISFLK